MAACMYLEVQRTTPGFQWTRAKLDEEIDALNASVEGNARVGSWRRRALCNIVLGMTAPVFQLLQDHYRQYTWERSCLNEEILADQGCWRAGQKLPKAKGEWQKVYTMSAEAMLLLAEALVEAWKKQWPKSRVRDASLKELQTSRITSSATGDDEPGPLRWSALACLLAHWAMPRAEAEFGKEAAAQLASMWRGQDTLLMDDLASILPARSEASSWSLVTLESLRSVYAALAKVKAPAPGGAGERLDQAMAIGKRWEVTKETIQRDKAGARQLARCTCRCAR